jgi:uncharacterized protein DUF6077
MYSLPSLNDKKKSADHKTATTTFYFIIYSFISCFGFWTLLCNVAYTFSLNFRTLSYLSPIALIAGIFYGLSLAKSTADQDFCQDATLETVPRRSQVSAFLGAAVLLMGLRAFYHNAYTTFWILCVIFLVAVLVSLRDGCQATNLPAPPITRAALISLLAFAGISAAITFAAHRDDWDDSLYVGIVADAVAHPELPVLRHDPLYGTGRFGLLMPTYATDSIELFTATLARFFGGAPLVWAHTLGVTFFALMLPFAWSLFMRSVTQRWIAGTALVMLLLVLLGESHYALGNFAFVRLFQGKSVLVSIAIPMLFACAWRFAAVGGLRAWTILFLSTLTAIGCSSSSLFIVPMALGICALTAWRPKAFWLALATFAPAFYPIAAGLALRRAFSPVLHTLILVFPSTDQIVRAVLGRHGQFVILSGLLLSPLLVRSARVGWQLATASLIIFVLILNPFLFGFFVRLATPEVAWRLLWGAPLVGFASIMLIGLTEFAEDRARVPGLVATVVAILIVLAVLMRYSTLRRANHVSFSLQLTKVRPDIYDVARAAAAAASDGTAVLAPEAVACWIPTFRERPPLVSVRAVYDRQMAAQMSAAETSERRQLRELVSEKAIGVGMPPHQFLDLLGRYHVGVVVTTEAAAFNLQAELLRGGFSIAQRRNGYVLFTLNKNATAPSPNAERMSLDGLPIPKPPALISAREKIFSGQQHSQSSRRLGS